MKNIEYIVRITVEVPDNFNVESAYLSLPTKIDVANDEDNDLTATIKDYETLECVNLPA